MCAYTYAYIHIYIYILICIIVIPHALKERVSPPFSSRQGEVPLPLRAEKTYLYTYISIRIHMYIYVCTYILLERRRDSSPSP